MDATMGEIRLVGFNFAPVGWGFCNGQLLAISEYDALYSLLGTTYGGDGQTTFALPNMQGRVVPGTGPAPGLSNYGAGQIGGNERVTLNSTNLPAHAHEIGGVVVAATTLGTGQNPPAAKSYPGVASSELYGPATGTDTMGPGAVSGTGMPVGGNQPHANLQPLLALNYIIALDGIYPSQP